jgi:hypothetical protein
MPVDDITHLTRLLEEHEKLQRVQVEATEKALVLAKEEAQRQYASLNNLRKEYVEERKNFVDRNVYEAKYEATQVELNTIHRKLDDVNGHFTTWGSVVLAVSVILQILLHMFWK